MPRFSSKKDFQPFLDSRGHLRPNVIRGIKVQWFLLLAKEKHGDKFQYDIETFNTTSSIISITCLTCNGIFQQKQEKHIYAGNGCPICSNSKAHCSNIYLLRCVDTKLVKIGISSSTRTRIQQIGIPVDILLDLPVPQAYLLEKELHLKFASVRTRHPTAKSGVTEFFTLTDNDISNIVALIKQHSPL